MPVTTIAPSKLPDALAAMAATLGDSMTAHDVGQHMTCGEADSIAAVLAAGGFTDDAAAFLVGHAQTDDDEGDNHHALVYGENQTQEGLRAAYEAAASYVGQLVGA